MEKRSPPVILRICWKGLQSWTLEAVTEALGLHCLDPDRGRYPPKPADLVFQLRRMSEEQKESDRLAREAHLQITQNRPAQDVEAERERVKQQFQELVTSLAGKMTMPGTRGPRRRPRLFPDSPSDKKELQQAREELERMKHA